MEPRKNEEKAPKRRLLPRWVRWTLGILVVLGFLLASTLALGGWWLENRTLGKEIRFGENGENRIRVHGADFSWWALRFRADSLWYRSPGLDARLGAFSADADLLAGLTQFRPAAKVTVDSAYLRLREDSTPKEEKPLDSLAFPDFKIPLAVSVKVRRFVLEDDSGVMVRADSLSARNGGRQEAEARVGAVRSRWTKTLAFAATASMDWSIRDSVALGAAVRRGDDRVDLKARHAKRPLWHGRDELKARIRETAPYMRALGIDSVPNARDIDLNTSVRLSRAPSFDLALSGALAAYRVSPDFTLSPQRIQLEGAWKDDRGTMRLQSRGQAGEDVLLRAEGRRLPVAKGRDSVPLWEQAAVSLRGHARNFRVRVQDTLRPADVVIERADWDGSRLSARLLTGDSSRLEAAGKRHSADRWNATFALNLNPRERWLRIFTGDNVAFEALSAQGSAEGSKAGPRVEATLAARKLEAYGVKLDSVRSFHLYGPEGYTLKPSRLYDKETVWLLSGTAKPPTAQAKARGLSIALDFELASAEHGRLRYALRPDGTMEAEASLFDVGALPYALLDSLPFQDPVLDGVFVWNPKRKTGRADLSAQAKMKKEDVEVRVVGDWDSRKLNLELASAKLKGSELNVRARARLNGRQFWEVYQVKPAQYEHVSIQTPGIDIAEVLAVFQPEPALSKGFARGELSYGDSAGFQGRLTFETIIPREAVGDVVLKELSLEGNGDTLFVNARTTSESEKLLNARLRLAVSALLQDEQRVRADLVAGDSLKILLDAATKRFQSFQGELRATGRAGLPEKSGSLENINLHLEFDVPVADPVNRSTLTTRAFEGIYVLPGLTRQNFSLNPTLRGGVFTVSNFSVKNDQGQSLSGNLEYALARKTLKAHIQGERFAAQWADDYMADLRNLNLDFTQDPKGLRIDGGFSSADFKYVDAPLYATGRLSSVRFGYDRPVAAPGTSGNARQRRAQNPASLTLSGNLSESFVRYRLKTFADLQKTFRKERQKRSSGPPLRLNVKLQTLGNDNRIDSDLLRLTWVGDLSVRGVHPYTLFNGRINSLSGGLGLDRQAYGIERFEVKWLNAPMEEGRISMEARKELVSDCNQRNETNPDSCTVITRLSGELSDMRFTYDSDCGGAFGAGASVAAILYSVQRGCYDPSIVAGGDGRGYGEKALTLLEPTINRSLSGVVGRYSGAWIEQTEITGLGSLSREEEAGGDTLGEALSLGITSKEYLRTRLKLRSGYHTASQDLSNPWEYMAALEWRPPAEFVTKSEKWRRRMDNNLRLVASLQTHPTRVDDPEEDPIEKKIGLNYTYFFWGNWWSKPRKPEETIDAPVMKPAQTTGEPQ